MHVNYKKKYQKYKQKYLGLIGGRLTRDQIEILTSMEVEQETIKALHNDPNQITDEDFSSFIDSLYDKPSKKIVSGGGGGGGGRDKSQITNLPFIHPSQIEALRAYGISDNKIIELNRRLVEPLSDYEFAIYISDPVAFKSDQVAFKSEPTSITDRFAAMTIGESKPSAGGDMRISKAGQEIHENLSDQINALFPKAMEQMMAGKKTTHWMWYFYPNMRPGRSDTFQTRVTRETAPLLLTNENWMALHRQVLKMLKDGKFIHEIFEDKLDRGRITFFIDFWKTIPEFMAIPDMAHYIQLLEQYFK